MNAILAKYRRRVDAANTLLCVGLDSEAARLPERFADDPHPQYAFNRYVIAQTHPYAAAYKPNMAFYEARGVPGLDDLQRTMDALRAEHPDIVTVCDAKRGDIGSTSDAYARAIFDVLGFDAVTLNPYLGQDALLPFLEREDRLCIILCRTSNPGARELQDLDAGGKPLWQVVAENVSQTWNTRGNCALVVGATYPDELRAVRRLAGDMLLLVPGLGAQGGDVQATVRAGLDSSKRGLMLNASRGILFAENPADAARALRDDINRWR